jgi:hypothetical protein
MRRFIAIVMLASLAGPFAPANAEDAKPQPAPPFAFADFSWVPGSAGASERPLTVGPFTGEFRFDGAYHYSFKKPKDDTISGSSEVFRHGEFQVTQLGIGGDLLYKNVMGRIMTQFGMYSETTPRNDASPGRGQWKLDDATVLRGYGGYHFDAMHGSTSGRHLHVLHRALELLQLRQLDLPALVRSSHAVVLQMGSDLPSDKLKIEPWLVNGWQSYGRFNNALGWGADPLASERLIPSSGTILRGRHVGNPTVRVHTDNSSWSSTTTIPARASKAAASLTTRRSPSPGGAHDSPPTSWLILFQTGSGSATSATWRSGGGDPKPRAPHPGALSGCHRSDSKSASGDAFASPVNPHPRQRVGMMRGGRRLPLAVFITFRLNQRSRRSVPFSN